MIMDIETEHLYNMTSKLTVLFVEDDDDTRLDSVDMLDALFKEVYWANDGAEGLKKYLNFYEEHGHYVDLVISDIMMPKMSGIDMAKEMVKYNKKQQIIFISAYEDSDYLVDLIDIGVSSFISKPIAYDTLKSVLHKNCIQIETNSLQNEKNPNSVNQDEKVQKNNSHSKKSS